jgi:hypothetical protein
LSAPDTTRQDRPAELSLLDLLAVLRRYTLFLLACLGIGAGLAVATLAWLEPVYQATAQLMIEPARDLPEDRMLAPAAIADDSPRSTARSAPRLAQHGARGDQHPGARCLARADAQLQDGATAWPSSWGIGRAAAGDGDPAALVDRFWSGSRSSATARPT